MQSADLACVPHFLTIFVYMRTRAAGDPAVAFSSFLDAILRLPVLFLLFFSQFLSCYCCFSCFAAAVLVDVVSAAAVVATVSPGHIVVPATVASASATVAAVVAPANVAADDVGPGFNNRESETCFVTFFL